MNDLIIQNVEDSIIEINNTPIILDVSVAKLYGVTTRDINKSVKNNPEKFPHGYVFELTEQQKSEVVEIFHHLQDKSKDVKNFDLLKKVKFSNKNPKAFTEQGLYMLATILKSEQATNTTIAIIETFTKMRNLQRNIKKASEAKTDVEKNNLLQKSGELIAEVLDNNLAVDETQTSIELNFAVLKFTHTIKKKANEKDE